jgi:hypothetical protein
MPPPTHQTATADTMPPDTIIASLKQGNALELDFIKKLKEGLEVIADGMQTECYKRGDTLEELKEIFEGVNLEEVSLYALSWEREINGRRATRVPAEVWLLPYAVWRARLRLCLRRGRLRSRD